MRLVFTAPVGLGALGEGITPNRPIASHASSWIMTLAESLGARRGVELDVLTCSPLVDRDQTTELGRVRFHVLSTQLPFLRRGLGLAGAHAGFAWPTARLARRVRTLSPDVVHGHGTEGPFGMAAVFAGPPHVVSLQGIMKRISVVEPTTSNRIAAQTESLTLHRARCVLAKSQYSLDYLAEIGFDGTVHHVEPAIRATFFSDPVPPGRNRLVTVGSLLERKGIEDLVSALSLLVAGGSDATLDIVGSGTPRYESELRAIISRSGLADRVRLLGELAPAEVHRALSAGGVFVLASHVENSPNSIMEAMAVGLPVVATDVGSVSHIVTASETGTIVAPHDVAGLARALADMLASGGRATAMGMAGRRAATARWHPDRITDQMMTVYERVAAA